jgi:hypothetical protein
MSGDRDTHVDARNTDGSAVGFQRASRPADMAFECRVPEEPTGGQCEQNATASNEPSAAYARWALTLSA